LEALITLIDLNTGADLSTSQWSGGMHQFIQLKHGCRLSVISLKAVFISNVAYLKRYQIINGLSGTLGSDEESKTLIDLYNADLIKIPSNKIKLFYEHVPIVTGERDKWFHNIYNQICNQINAERSVLLICENIKQLEEIENKLDKIRATAIGGRSKQHYNIEECFDNVIVYKREHDEFKFEDKKTLEPKRLIIATNLAGRGTDIQLSEQLIQNGGLHVIISFVPQNYRTEEQAYGRAAR
jgi:golgin subfamily B member 1